MGSIRRRGPVEVGRLGWGLTTRCRPWEAPAAPQVVALRLRRALHPMLHVRVRFGAIGRGANLGLGLDQIGIIVTSTRATVMDMDKLWMKPKPG